MMMFNKEPFCLRSTQNTLILNGIRGTFVKIASGSFVFREVDEPHRRFPVENLFKTFHAILEWQATSDTTCSLSGRWEPPNFYVTGLDFGDKHLEDKMRFMFKRMSSCDPDNTSDNGSAKASPTAEFTRHTDIEMYLSIAGHTLPPTIRTWAENLMAKRSNLSSAETRHVYRVIGDAIQIDWSHRPIQMPPVHEVRTALDNAFYGLEQVKERFLEVAAQVNHCGSTPKWGILLNGPAGVGKSMIAQAFADLLGLPLRRIDMSTTCDLEALTGSSMIYDNGRQGSIMDGMVSARDSRMVFLMQEVDKIHFDGKDGNPENALLTLMDGCGFVDSYWNCVVPTDQLFFIATCNDSSKLSAPLRDRFIEVNIPAYTQAEKRAIFDRFVLPRAMDAAKVAHDAFRLTEPAAETLIQRYAVEPGVRDLERFAQRLIGHYLRLKAEGITKIKYCENDLFTLFGPGHAIRRVYDHTPGLARGAYEHNGHVNTFVVQAATFPGDGKFEVLGPATPLQKDFARAAWLCAKGIMNAPFQQKDVVVNLMEAVPDDTHNTIGLAVFFAVCSAMMDVCLPKDSVCLGGVDLLGNLYFDGNNLDPFLTALEESNLSVLMGPAVLNELPLPPNRISSVRIMGSLRADILFFLAQQNAA